MNKQDYIFMARAMGSNKTTDTLGAEFDMLDNELNPPQAPAPTPPEHEPGISDFVDAWLKGLKQSADEADNAMFENIRKDRYELQYAAWDAAGRPGEV